MPSPEDHGAKVRQGLRHALRRGASLGGLRPERERRNRVSHLETLQQALGYRKVLETGGGKSLAALSRDLFDAGCRTAAGGPLPPVMVRRMRARMDEALLALAAAALEDESSDWEPENEPSDGGQESEPSGWDPENEINLAAGQRNEVALRWHLKTCRKECGDVFTDRLMRGVLASEYGNWVRAALADPWFQAVLQSQHFCRKALGYFGVSFRDPVLRSVADDCPDGRSFGHPSQDSSSASPLVPLAVSRRRAFPVRGADDQGPASMAGRSFRGCIHRLRTGGPSDG